MPSQFELVLFTRLLISVLLGVLIGFERTNRYKEAGIRTHAIVALGSCC
jgi:putative Mg2+ transporter-C (MgtC) family protein